MVPTYDDVIADVLSPRQIKDVLIELLDHAAHHKLDALEANLAISLEELMGDINQREREASPSRTNCDPKIIDFSDARLRRLQAARDDTGVRDTDPSRTTGA